jgi:hypothetical protein
MGAGSSVARSAKPSTKGDGITGDGYESCSVILHFVHRSVFEKDAPMPRLEELLEEEKCTLTITATDLTKKSHKDFPAFIMISHRWTESHHPDLKQEQRKAVKEFLQKNPDTTWLWFDFSSMPQEHKDEKGLVLKKRTDEEKSYFVSVLKYINCAYLFFAVLVIFDQEYATRFWCLYETFLATHALQDGEIICVPREKANDRLHVVYCGTLALSKASVQTLQLDMLWAQWGEVDLPSASHQLGGSDIRVTNQSDKDQQIKRLENLAATVQLFIKATQVRHDELDQLSKEDLIDLIQASDSKEIDIMEKLGDAAAHQADLATRLAKKESELAAAQSQLEQMAQFCVNLQNELCS